MSSETVNRKPKLVLRIAVSSGRMRAIRLRRLADGGERSNLRNRQQLVEIATSSRFIGTPRDDNTGIPDYRFTNYGLRS